MNSHAAPSRMPAPASALRSNQRASSSSSGAAAAGSSTMSAAAIVLPGSRASAPGAKAPNALGKASSPASAVACSDWTSVRLTNSP